MLRQDKKQQTKIAIIEAAYTLFAKNGIATTTTANIARACGVSHGTIFVHFKERSDLLSAVVGAFCLRLSEELARRMKVQESVADILKTHLETISDCEDFYFRLLTEIYALPWPLQAQLLALNGAVSSKLYEAASQQMKSGAFKKMSRPLIFNTWMALVSYYITHRGMLTPEMPITLHKQKELVEHYLNLMQA